MPDSDEGANIAEERLPGGKLTHVVRVNDTVRRHAQVWSPDVHHLLTHLHQRGFSLSPEPLGTDSLGRDSVRYIPGDTSASVSPWPGSLWSDALLEDAGRAVARYHRTVADFRPLEAAHWQFRPRALRENEIICHHDFAVYNAVFRDATIVGMIDWECAGPGTIEEELAFMSWQWTPLGPPELIAQIGCDPDIDQAKRLRRLLDSYGYEERSGLIDAVIARIELSRQGIEERSAAGEPAWVALRDEGHTRDMERVIEYVTRRRRDLQAAIE